MPYDRSDQELVVELATSSASLDRSPKKNWVENSGELPAYIRKLARAIEKSGKSLSSAIAIAISRVKKWAAGGDDVDADTRAKAAKALAEWEALKAKNKARKGGKKVKLAAGPMAEHGSYVALSVTSSFNTDIVNRAWNARRDAAEREQYAAERRGEAVAPAPYSWIRELWTDFIIVDTGDKDGGLVKVPYEVHNGDDVVFGEPVSVRQTYVEDEPLSAAEKALLADILSSGSALERIANLAGKL